MEKYINQSLIACKTLLVFFRSKGPINYAELPSRSYLIVKGVLKMHFLLIKEIERFCQKPPKSGSLTEIVLLVGLYQVHFTNFRPRNEILETAEKLNLKNLKGFFNAILSKASNSNIERNLSESDNSLYTKILKIDYPDRYQEITKSNLNHSANCLRIYNQEQFFGVNQKLDYQQTELAKAIILSQNLAARDLPGFNEGWFYIQSLSAQYLELFLDKSSKTVLDACCGAGGKTFIARQILGDNCKIHANDINQAQLDRFHENKKRLSMHVDRVTCRSLHEISEKFDLILLDVPCSASGNIKNHPEIKFRITESELDRLGSSQSMLLEHAWSLLNSGGSIIYMTCSVFKRENSDIISKFLETKQNAKVEQGPKIKNSIQDEFGTQILPNEIHSGFFYSKINNLE